VKTEEERVETEEERVETEEERVKTEEEQRTQRTALPALQLAYLSQVLAEGGMRLGREEAWDLELSAVGRREEYSSNLRTDHC
jgi:hypothetical protein